MLQQTKSVHRLMFLDAEANEDYSRTEVTMTDVPQMIQQFMVAVAGAAGTPARIFFSSSPSGLNANASGNSDLSQFYADCADYQRRGIGPQLENVLTAIAGGRDTVRIEWPSLWESSDNERAQTRLAHMNADKVAWDMGFGAKQIAQDLTLHLLPDYSQDESECVEFDLSKVGALEEDQDALWMRVDKAVSSGWIQINEARAMIDEGIEVLTGVKAGDRNSRARFPAGTINRLVEDKLKSFAERFDGKGKKS